MTNNNEKPAAPKNPPLYNNNIDSLGFESLIELMGRRKAKFLDLQNLLSDREEKPRPFWKVLRDARKPKDRRSYGAANGYFPIHFQA